MASRTAVDAFIAQPALALVGLSRSGKKFGNAACRTLRDRGYRLYPIHPSADTIDGVRCYRRFADLPEPVDSVLVIVPPQQALTIVREAAAAGIRRVWLQQGSSSPAVLQACAELGLQFVADECILMFAEPAGFHKLHRWVNGVLGRLPARTP